MVLEQALAQLPAAVSDRQRDEPVAILARSDSAGATHQFAAALRERRIGFSLGYYMTETVGQAALALPEGAWRPALDGDGTPRDGAWVAELTGHLDLSGWPQGSRLIVRKERPRPARICALPMSTGTATSAFWPTSPTPTSSRWRSATGCTRASRTASPKPASSASRGYLRWLLDQRDLAGADPARPRPARLAAHQRPRRRQRHAGAKRLRHRLLHVAGRLTRSARQRTLDLPARWPWAAQLIAAYARLRALPASG
jgi:hypothetical protein